MDCADFARVGLTKQYFEEDALILNIDHHPTNDGYGTVNIIKPDAAATAEILFDFVGQFPIQMDKAAATAIYTGLLTDTGGFRYANTSPNVMTTASKLLEYGVDGPMLAQILLEQVTLPQVRILNKALSSLKMTDDGKIAWVVITPEDMVACGAANEDLEGIVNYPRNIEGVEVGIFSKSFMTRPSKSLFVLQARSTSLHLRKPSAEAGMCSLPVAGWKEAWMIS